MKNKMIKISTKISVAMFVAASALTMAPITAHAAEEIAIVEEVAADEMAAFECEMSASETEGQGDVIDDEFAVDPEVEGQGDVIDDEFAVDPEVEGQGDVIDDEFAVDSVVDENADWHEGDGDMNPFHIYYQKARVLIEEANKADEARRAEEAKRAEEEAKAAEEAKRAEEMKKIEEERKKMFDEVAAEVNAAMMKSQTAVIQNNEAVEKETPKTETKKTGAPAISMEFSTNFFGYHGKEVNYKNLEVGKYYLMQIPKSTFIPNFNYRVVKILGSYTNKGIFFDDVMVKYNQYHWSGKLDKKNKTTQVNENLLNQTPNHFFEITDDILAK